MIFRHDQLQQKSFQKLPLKAGIKAITKTFCNQLVN